METPKTPNSSDMQFTTSELLVEKNRPAGLTCAACNQPILNTYFALGNQVLCDPCKTVATAPPKGSGFARFVKAVLFGTVAGLIGAAIWYAIRIVTNLEIGLIAILVGFLVGKAVHTASGRKGGVGYQILAVLITYCCIAANYLPDVYQAFANNATEQESTDNAKLNAIQPNVNVASNADTQSTESPTDDKIKSMEPDSAESGLSEKIKAEQVEAEQLPLFVRLILFAVILITFALATPILICTQSPISILIFGFALWEAWKFSAYHPLPIMGPYQADTDRVPSSQSA